MFSKSSLEMLDAVARLGSFTAAAEVLHKVPSAISYSVRQIESELGVVLFRRLPRKVELTPLVSCLCLRQGSYCARWRRSARKPNALRMVGVKP